MESWRRGEIDWDGNPIVQDEPHDEKSRLAQPLVEKCMVVLNRTEDIPGMMTITQLLSSGPRKVSKSSDETNNLKVHCLRLMELTQRTSTVMKVSERHFDRLDPIINVFRTFGNLNNVIVSTKMAIVPDDSFADSVYYQAFHHKMEMVMIPWTNTSHSGTIEIPTSEFVKQVLEKVQVHVGVMIDTRLFDDESEPNLTRSISMSSLRNKPAAPVEIENVPVIPLTEGYHVFLPYFGGRDDRVALATVIQLAMTSDVKATIVRIRYEEVKGKSVSPPVEAHTIKVPEPEIPDVQSSIPKAFSSAISKVRFLPGLTSRSDPIVVEQDSDSDDDGQVNPILDAIPADLQSRIHVETVRTTTPVQYAIKRAKEEIERNHSSYHLTVIGRSLHHPRTNDLATILHQDLLNSLRSYQTLETLGRSYLGDVAEGMILGNVTGGLLVLQSGKEANES
jgi:hypothetical protein